jgi:hypothetical protein
MVLHRRSRVVSSVGPPRARIAKYKSVARVQHSNSQPQQYRCVCVCVCVRARARERVRYGLKVVKPFLKHHVFLHILLFSKT